MFTVVSLTPTLLHGAEPSSVMLFYNDRAWTLARLPVEKIHSMYYVPISFMVQLPNVEVRVNNALKTFIITHGDYYLSFDITSDFAVNQEKKRMYIKTGEYHNERYVPVGTVCAYLQLGYEELTNPSTGALAIRVTDGNQTKPLKELAEEKFPALFGEQTSPAETTQTTPESTKTPETTVPKPLLPQRTVYITFEDSPGKYTNEILEVLKSFDTEATFFVVGEKMDESAEVISKIAAGGHTLALQSMKEADDSYDTYTLLYDIETQNELLYKLIKKKSHVRKAPEATADTASQLSQTADALREQGYFIWRANVTVPANARNARTAANIAIDGIWKNEIAVLCFEENQYTAAALRMVLNFIKENSDSCELRTVSPIFWEDGAAVN